MRKGLIVQSYAREWQSIPRIGTKDIMEIPSRANGNKMLRDTGVKSKGQRKEGSYILYP